MIEIFPLKSAAFRCAREGKPPKCNQARGQSRVNKTKGPETCWEGSYAERMPKRNGTEHFGIVSFDLLFTTQEQKTPTMGHSFLPPHFLFFFTLKFVDSITKTGTANPTHGTPTVWLRFCYFVFLPRPLWRTCNQFDITTLLFSSIKKGTS